MGGLERALLIISFHRFVIALYLAGRGMGGAQYHYQERHRKLPRTDHYYHYR